MAGSSWRVAIPGKTATKILASSGAAVVTFGAWIGHLPRAQSTVCVIEADAEL